MVVLLPACSTTKNTWLSRNYNELTARYNILYNGTESFKQGEKSLMVNSRENYTAILPLFPYSGPEKAGLVTSEMELAIEKGQKLIKEKSIKAKPKQKPKAGSKVQNEFYNRREFNQWVDEAYMLIGKAHLYNHKFDDAIQYFDFILREFPNSTARFEAIIWMARTRIEMGDLENALLLLNQYDGMGQAPNRLYGEYMATFADYHIHRGQYQTAISFMVAAAQQAQGKWNKARRNYILGQLYMQSGQQHLAQQMFLKVVRSNPEYEMNLNARLNLAIIHGNLGGNNQVARKELAKLLRQTKNQEFRDRIYYIYAQSYLNERDTLSAITNLRLAAGYNSGNEALKGETFLQLASLYFDDEQYLPSYTYYDSTVIVLKESDARIVDIKQRHEGLKDLAQHYTIIYTEDSVRRIAAMPKDKREAFVDNLIEQQRLAAEQSSQQGMEQQGGLADDPLFYQNYSNQLMGKTDSKGQWYFYNPTTASLGKMDFEKRWGRRVSEDNWRRSDKGISTASQDMTSPNFPQDGADPNAPLAEGEIPGEPGSLPEAVATKGSLLAALPTTPEMIAASDDRLAKAYFDAGMVFFNEFNDYRKAAMHFTQVATNYPNHMYAEQAWFWAFRCYAILENTNGMNETRAGLLKHFPDSRYTAFVVDADFMEKQQQKESEVNQAYENAYQSYLSGNYQQSLASASTVLTDAEKEELIRKSHLLKAVTYGKAGNTAAFEIELQTLVDQYKESSEGMFAVKWLAMLKAGRMPIAGPVKPIAKSGADSISQSIEPIVEATLFQFEPVADHFIILIVNSEADINRLFFNLADYNFSRFILGDYEIDMKSLPDGQRVVTVGRFANNREAMDYFFALRENASLFKVENMADPSIFAGSESNLTLLLSSGDVNGYRNFFSQNYLSGSGGTIISLFSASSTEEKEANAEIPIYKVSADKHWGMVVLAPKIDRVKIVNFLTNHALNTMRMRATVLVETLPSGEEVLLIQTFDTVEAVFKFFKSLDNNYFWNTQLGARDWQKTAITPANFDIMKTDGSVVKYLEFFDNNYLTK